ncbi:MAG TPA: hypothetical protein VFI61_02185 [Patescibacteria group bacterium]|nr:hypothetical protein [Patescibacteria group bacterium]
MRKGETGFIQIVIIVLLLIGIVIVFGATYFLLKPKEAVPVATISPSSPTNYQTQATQIPQVASDTNSKDPKTFETELDTTDLDAMDSDLNSLEVSANSI